MQVQNLGIHSLLSVYINVSRKINVTGEKTCLHQYFIRGCELCLLKHQFAGMTLTLKYRNNQINSPFGL